MDLPKPNIKLPLGDKLAWKPSYPVTPGKIEFLDKIKSLLEPPKYDMFSSTTAKPQDDFVHNPTQADPNHPQQPSGQQYPMQQYPSQYPQQYPDQQFQDQNQYQGTGFQPFQGQEVQGPQGFHPSQGQSQTDFQPNQAHMPQSFQPGQGQQGFQPGQGPAPGRQGFQPGQGHGQGFQPGQGPGRQGVQPGQGQDPQPFHPGQGQVPQGFQPNQGQGQPGFKGQGQGYPPNQTYQQNQGQGYQQSQGQGQGYQQNQGQGYQQNQGQGQGYQQNQGHGYQQNQGQGQGYQQNQGQGQHYQQNQGQGQGYQQNQGQGYQQNQGQGQGYQQNQGQGYQQNKGQGYQQSKGQGYPQNQRQKGISAQGQGYQSNQGQGMQQSQRQGFQPSQRQGQQPYQDYPDSQHVPQNQLGSGGLNQLGGPTYQDSHDTYPSKPHGNLGSQRDVNRLHPTRYSPNINRQTNMEPRSRGGGTTGEQIALRPIRDREVAGTSRERPKLQAVHTFSTETSGIGTSVVSSFDRSFDLDHPQDPELEELHKRSAMNYDPDDTRYTSYPDAGPHSNTGRGFDRLFQQSGKAGEARKLNVADHMDASEWNKYKRRDEKGGSPKDSPSSSRRGSFKDSKGKSFLTAPNATWVKWSQARRNSFQRRLTMIEQREKEAEKSRVSTPVKKARTECVKFVSREMEDQIAAEANEPVRKKPVKKVKKKEKKKRGDKREDPLKKIKLTDAQWHVMMDFWENPVFIKSRYIGIVMSILALAFAVVSQATTAWSTFYDYHSGLWDSCFHANITEEAPFPSSCQHLPNEPWQKGIIGLLLFSAVVGFLATILSICGICVNNLPKKLYYYHSAGEIYFICALICTAGLVAYPWCIETSNLIDHKYGYAYCIGWGASVGYFASALCMMLDDLIQSSATGCCRRKRNDMQHV